MCEESGFVMRYCAQSEPRRSEREGCSNGDKPFYAFAGPLKVEGEVAEKGELWSWRSKDQNRIKLHQIVQLTCHQQQRTSRTTYTAGEEPARSKLVESERS